MGTFVLFRKNGVAPQNSFCGRRDIPLSLADTRDESEDRGLRNLCLLRQRVGIVAVVGHRKHQEVAQCRPLSIRDRPAVRYPQLRLSRWEAGDRLKRGPMGFTALARARFDHRASGLVWV